MYSLGPFEAELICIDDDSQESGTKEYLSSLKEKGWRIINQEDHRQNPKEESTDNVQHISSFSEALNLIYSESSGDLIIPLQGDMQFIRNGWIGEVINLFENFDNVGTLVLDAQRRIRLENSCSFEVEHSNGFDYFIDTQNPIINGAGDTVYSRKLLDAIGGWTISSTTNAEDNFTSKVHQRFGASMLKYSLKVPASAAIYTDPRGTNARIRGSKRYGSYWAAPDDLYYQYTCPSSYGAVLNRPYSIEEVVKANGDWELPIDEDGSWKKNPIDVTSSNEGEEIL